jgi:type II secretory pathway predicted ATPase ExeA
MFCLDEVQHCGIEALEVVRELNDEAGCGILLAGSHEFGRFLDINAVKLEQWHSRTHMRERLPGLNAAEAEEVVRAEMGEETHAQYVRRIWAEATEECSKVRTGTCAFCNGPTTNFPITESGMLRQVVICSCCSKPGCPHQERAA